MNIMLNVVKCQILISSLMDYKKSAHILMRQNKKALPLNHFVNSFILLRLSTLSPLQPHITTMHGWFNNMLLLLLF